MSGWSWWPARSSGAVALGLIGLAREVWQVWVLYAVFGVGNSGVSLVPATTVVTRWFPGRQPVHRHVDRVHRSLSVGGVLLAPASAQAIHFLGVATAMPWFAVVYLAVIATHGVAAREFLAAGILNRAYPCSARSRWRSLQPLLHRCDDRLRCPDGGAGGRHRPPVQPRRDSHRPHRRIHRRVLARADEHRRSPTGRLPAGGWFPPSAFSPGSALPSRHWAWASSADAQTPVTSLLGTAVFGLSVGNLLMLQPLLLVQAFGVQHYPRLFAVSHACSTIGVAGGPLAMGIIHDASSYAGSFGAAAVASAAALVVFIAAGALPRVPDAVVVPADPIRRR